MAKPRFVAGIDVGTTKVCGIAAEVSADGQVHFLGASNVPARGIQKGAVVDLEAAAAAVSSAVDRLGVAVRRKIDRVTVGTSIEVASLNSRGTGAPAGPGRPLAVEDLRRAVAAAAEGLPASRHVLHAIPRQCSIDGQAGISNPIGLFGGRVDVDVHLVTASSAAVMALLASIERCGVEVEQVVSQPLAAAEVALTVEERELGVVVADIGAAASSVSVFVDGTPWHSATVPVGGRHITSDVATVLSIPTDEAEELKLAGGHCISSSVDPAEMLDVTLVDGGGALRVSRQYLCQIVEARAVEIIGLIGEEIQRSGYTGLLPAGVVLTGGTARLPGIARLASEMLQCRVRIGQPAVVDVPGLNGPAQASAVGLILCTINNGSSSANRWWSYSARAGLLAESSSAPQSSAKLAPRWWRGLWSPTTNGGRKGSN